MPRLKLRSILYICCSFALLIPICGYGYEFITSETYFPNKIELISGKSIIMRSSKPIKRVSVGVDVIASFIQLSPYEVYVTGNMTGLTNMILWEEKKVAAIYDIEVKYDIARLKRVLHEQLPEEKEYQVYAAENSITLTGRVSSAENLSRILSLVNAYAGYIIKTEESSKETGETKVKYVRAKRNINNLLQVGGSHQVMLEVRFAEMSRTITRRLGFNFLYQAGSEFGYGPISGLTELDAEAEGLGILVSPVINAIFQFNAWGGALTSFIDALKEEGLVEILAEPTLIALSGQTASFLAGGEFPIPVPQGNQTISIDYKSFGVYLSFTPTVLSENRISIKVSPEVSNLDLSTAVTVGGFVVPGLNTRRMSTVVELADGQSFAIAGLLNETARDSASKYPLLGDIPILGRLFQSQSFQSSETELVVIVTPHLVKPLDMTKQTLPTDFYITPDDTEFFIMGLMEGRKKETSPSDMGKVDGKFGHELPVIK